MSKRPVRQDLSSYTRAKEQFIIPNKEKEDPHYRSRNPCQPTERYAIPPLACFEMVGIWEGNLGTFVTQEVERT
jgi:hypothetical protein